MSFGWICRAAAHFMAVDLLIRKYIDVFVTFLMILQLPMPTAACLIIVV